MQRSTCFYILLKSESCVKPKWAIIKGTGAVVRRFDDKRNTATQVRPKPLRKQTNYRWGNEETSQYINHMEKINDYDYIVIHSGTNDVGKLTANEIRTNTENCLVNLKHRWPNSTIAISRVTYVPRDNSKNQLIDEINCHYESIWRDLGVTFIDNKRVTCDNYGNLIEQVLGISAWGLAAGTLDPLT